MEVHDIILDVRGKPFISKNIRVERWYLFCYSFIYISGCLFYSLGYNPVLPLLLLAQIGPAFFIGGSSRWAPIFFYFISKFCSTSFFFFFWHYKTPQTHLVFFLLKLFLWGFPVIFIGERYWEINIKAAAVLIPPRVPLLASPVRQTPGGVCIQLTHVCTHTCVYLCICLCQWIILNTSSSRYLWFEFRQYYRIYPRFLLAVSL